MNIFTYSLGAMKTNCYLLSDGENSLIIDPGDEADFLLEQLIRKRLRLKAIIATHGHFDHIMAAYEIQASIDTPFYIFKEDMFLVKRVNETAKYFLGYDPQALFPKNIRYLKKGKLTIQNFEFNIFQSPGHTPGSGCLYFKKENAIFTGDTLFKKGIGRFDFSYSNKNDLDHSLKNILSLPEKTLVYPGHGESTIIKDEKNKVF